MSKKFIIRTMSSQKAVRLAFGCEARVGKDTACDYLMKKLASSRPERMSFAGALYDILYYAQEVCGFPKAKDRKFLQWVGTEWARAQDPDVWINIVRRKIEATPSGTPIIVTDVRFPNEAKMLSEMGFTMVRIKRDPMLRGETLNTGHLSEIGLMDYAWDVIIENNSTLEQLYREMDMLIAGKVVCLRCGSGRPTCRTKKPDGSFYSHDETCATYIWTYNICEKCVNETGYH